MKRKTALVIEDNEMNMKLVRALLQTDDILAKERETFMQNVPRYFYMSNMWGSGNGDSVLTSRGEQSHGN